MKVTHIIIHIGSCRYCDLSLKLTVPIMILSKKELTALTFWHSATSALHGSLRVGIHSVAESPPPLQLLHPQH